MPVFVRASRRAKSYVRQAKKGANLQIKLQKQLDSIRGSLTKRSVSIVNRMKIVSHARGKINEGHFEKVLKGYRKSAYKK